MKKGTLPGCTCGSKECGLVWILDENRYQCGMCIQKTYAKVAKLLAKPKEKSTQKKCTESGNWFG